MTSKPRGSTKSKRTFEQALEEVEDIVARLEGGKLELAQSLDEYQRGIGTLKECYEILSEAERRITLLSGFDADGNPITEPFEEQPMTTEAKQSARSARRSAPVEKSMASPRFDDTVESDYFDDAAGPQDGLF